MRIAYITTYQGPSLLEQRPVVRNRSLSNTVKIELIASFLQSTSHCVEVISQGEVVENSLKFFPPFSESKRFHADIPVHYASALPIRGVNGLWSSRRTLEIFKSRHRAHPFDLVIIFNLKEPQVECANYAIRHLRLPVILEYEDDRFVNVIGQAPGGLLFRYRERQCRRLLQQASGCIAVSPHLLSQLPVPTPKMLLRGAVGDDVIEATERSRGVKRNRVLFSGTHIESNGVAALIDAWRTAPVEGWELHITGYGALTDSLRQRAMGVPGVVFHGLVSRRELVELMSSAQICVNPQTPSLVPGNVFAFKIIEYLAAGAHCVTTPMGTVEPDLEAGMTYIPNNSPQTIAETLRRVIEDRRYERRAMEVAQATYGPQAVARSLNRFLMQVVNGRPNQEL